MNIDTDLVYMWLFFSVTMIIYWSFLEWWVHKYPMHDKKFKKYPIARLLFESHIGPKGHHSRHGYCPNHPECHDHNHEHEPILQKVWFGFLVAFLGSLPFVLLESLTTFKYCLSIICFVSIYGYYWLFELVHVATHDGKHWQRSFLKKLGYFDIMLDHHMIHHTIKFNMNFTLVNHWADYLFNTKYKAKSSTVFLVRYLTIVILCGILITFFKLV